MNTPIISASELRALGTDPSLIILDASPTSNKSGLKTEFADLQIKGARFFDLKSKFSDQSSEMPNTLPSPENFERECRNLGINQNSKIVVYDNLGIYTSARVWWMFSAMGHKNIAVLNGGLPEWINAGFETEPISKKTFPAGNFKSNPNFNLKTNIESVVENIDTQDSIVIDARSEGRFEGTAPEPREGLKSGHIPNSKNLPFDEVLEDGKMKTPEELEAIFEALNFEEKPMIFSCGSGLTACIIMLAAETVSNIPKSVYDGSWTEWAQKQSDLIIR